MEVAIREPKLVDGDKLLEVVSELGVELGYAVILEKNTQVVFASAATDMSQVVIDRFNQKYPGTTAAPAE